MSSLSLFVSAPEFIGRHLLEEGGRVIYIPVFPILLVIVLICICCARKSRAEQEQQDMITLQQMHAVASQQTTPQVSPGYPMVSGAPEPSQVPPGYPFAAGVQKSTLQEDVTDKENGQAV
eukprot:TRINITY_DN2502_c0_g1_i1.p3 TRINITY_DN2502_c0_g1~~TRINITY_DN2502_c0_g1_i1.p3  ORF type:complete len:120 (-),score=12.73 TRINITY_DN2502_c0_g1_i1:370-729(-)